MHTTELAILLQFLAKIKNFSTKKCVSQNKKVFHTFVCQLRKLLTPTQVLRLWLIWYHLKLGIRYRIYRIGVS